MNTHLKQLWAAMKLPEKLQKSYKFFCRGLDIRVAKIMKPHLRHPVFCYVLRKVLRQIVRAHALSQLVHKDITVVLVVIAIAANLLV